jgi:hypothetical protein
MKAKVGTGARIIAVSFIVSLVALAAYRPFSHAASGTPVLITEKIDESELVTVTGNTRPEANAKERPGTCGGWLFDGSHVVTVTPLGRARNGRLSGTSQR